MAKSAEYYFQDHEPSGELGRLALRGGVVSVVSGYGNGVLQLIAAIVLARLLTPDDFGLVAIITVLTSFAFFLIDFGVGDATTQRSRITQSQVSSLFWLSSGIGFAIAAVLAACGPLIASLYRTAPRGWRQLQSLPARSSPFLRSLMPAAQRALAPRL